MALQLMKLFVGVTTTISIEPESQKFFYVTTGETAAEATLSIDTSDFFDDTGAVPVELPEIETENSYYNVYINGVLQMAGISTYTPGPTTTGSLDITVPEDSEPLLADTPIVLELIIYSPTSDTTVLT
ncbi:DUF4183 domain-containing protein [Sutcliffiella halmapala]|uniref:DUF4183 domain-containing protein n=1 Tax=Sutcliffiella halmapala TaxID=79882 RepID=UPI000995701B|nr:DUF4183 domain-containing protein [Sutcliffiella halmapala]